MELSKAIERCKELIKSEHDRWIGLTNQEAIETVLQKLEVLQKENEQLREFGYKTILKINERCNVFNGRNFVDDAIKNELEKLKRQIEKMINELLLKGE